MKRLFKIIISIICILLLMVIAYVAYVFLTYNRIKDKVELSIERSSNIKTSINVEEEIYITSYNIGFGAYVREFSFFMDGGDKSRALSKDKVIETVKGAGNYISSKNPNIALFQEVDYNSTRSHKVDEREILKNKLIKTLGCYAYTFGINYHSAYLFYPINSPHGKNNSGLVTISDTNIIESKRISLPIETGFSKILDLDRCYTKNYIKVSNEKNLIVYNVHLSAYTSKEETAENQLKLLINDMEEEYNKGNYCLAGGDFNRDLLGNSPEVFNTETIDDNWAKPINKDLFNENIRLVVPFNEDNPVASCRDSGKPYEKGMFQVLLDGFIISKNIEDLECNVLDTEYEFSDHNPVGLRFILK